MTKPAMVMVLLCLGTVVRAETRVKVCHIPPGDTATFHTITIGESAVPAHVAHGDFVGDCSAYCSSLCDDGNACTIDACDPSGTGCAASHPPVNCDDSNACTTDSCTPSLGCVYSAINCNDGNACTTDSCDPTLGCTYAPVTCALEPGCASESCDTVAGCTCVLPDCDDGDPCTADSYDAAAGACMSVPLPKLEILQDCDPSSAVVQTVCGDGTYNLTPFAASSISYVLFFNGATSVDLHHCDDGTAFAGQTLTIDNGGDANLCDYPGGCCSPPRWNDSVCSVTLH